jgi:hypothetical protein
MKMNASLIRPGLVKPRSENKEISTGDSSDIGRLFRAILLFLRHKI